MSWLQTIRSYKPSPKVEKTILLVAMLVLVAGVALSLRDNPGILSQIDWQALAIVVVIGVPITAVVNAMEFVVSAHMVGVNFPLLRSMKVTIIGSAANMLPLPGATLVRIAALKVSGVGFKKSAAVTLFVAMVWIGSSFFYSGVMLAQFEAGPLAWGMGLAGFALLILSAWVTKRSDAHVADYGKIVVLKFAMVLIDAGRIYLCFLALGFDVAFTQASAFVVSSVLGSAVSVVPAGLGVREVVSAGLAPIVAVAVSAGFLSATLNRIAGLAALLPIAGVLFLLDRNQKKAQP
jgi:uncharacterized membrane protein YbhN (UPF0104 family)